MNRLHLYKSQVEMRKIWAILRKDKYDRLAAELQDVLLLGWNQATKDAINEVIRAIKGREKFSREALNRMSRELSIRLGLRFANRIAAPLLEIETATYEVGMKDIIKIKPTFHLVDQRALEMLQRHNIFWVREFFDRQLGEQVEELGRQVIEQGLTREQAGQLYIDAFKGRFQSYSWRYWQGYSNHVVTRSREMGRIEGYVRAGVEFYEVRAVLDYRTTDICREMHGRIIPVKNGVALRDKLIAAESPEEVKEIAPWMKPEQVRGKKSSRLNIGLALPPYHFNCRSRTVIWHPPAEAYRVDELEYGKDLSRNEKKTLAGLTEEEYSNWLATIQGRQKLNFAPESLEAAYERDAAKLKVKSKDEYLQLARRLVKKPKQIFAQIAGGEKQFVFWGEGGYAVVNENAQLIGVHPYSGRVSGMAAKRLWLKRKL